MTSIELLYAIAERAKILSEEKINKLRIRVGTQDTPQSSIREMQHRGRGDMIEEILIDEFEDEATAIEEKME